MGPKDDITDAFDDDELKRSIESANEGGEWRDGANTKFVEPKLMAIAEQLAKAPSTTYTERRFAELERRAAAKNAATTRESNRPAGAAADWRQTLARKGDEPAVPPVIEPALPSAKPRAALAHARTVGMAFGVFTLAAVLQGMIGGFTIDLWLRAAIAAIAAGTAWILLAAGRFRAAGLGGAAHLAAFLSTADVGNRAEMSAVFLGLFVVLLGSGAAGLVHEGSQRTGG